MKAVAVDLLGMSCNDWGVIWILLNPQRANACFPSNLMAEFSSTVT
jgi:hypothetical protein